MATKKKLTEEQLKKNKADNAVVYKVIIAMALMCLTVMGLRRLRAFYATLGGVMALFDRTHLIVIGGLVVAVVSLALLIFLRKTAVRLVCPWTLAYGALIATTGIVMRTSMTDHFYFLYFLAVSGFMLYIIFMLYRWEFFLVSLTTLVSGGGFFAFSRGFGIRNAGKWILLALVVIWVLTFACAFLASRRKGRIIIGRLNYPMFSSRFTPMLLYVINILWLVCTVGALLLGSLFSYYCMFAAIAVEFIAAVYYTFQLK